MIESTNEFAYPENYADVFGSRMHYIEQGEGPVVLFVHGVPTWSYLWRNVIPYLSEHYRCIAVDLIGFGKSDKPDIHYDVFNHISYLEAFIRELKLNDIVMVMHGWGSVIGTAVASKHPELFKGLAYLESHLRAIEDWSKFSLPVQELSQRFKSPLGAYQMVTGSNYYVDHVLTAGVLDRLDDAVLQQYRMPFKTAQNREPIWQYIQDIPAFSSNVKVLQLIKDNNASLLNTKTEKLLMYGMPGFITSMETVKWAKESLVNCSVKEIGEALHYAPENESKTNWRNLIGLASGGCGLINVMIVDDHAIVRLGIRRLLEDVDDINVVCEAENGEKALENVKTTPLDVVLLDMKMPGIDGLEVTRRLRRRHSAIKIIAVSAVATEPFPSRILQAGALGYLTKECGVDEMTDAIRRVFRGERYLSAEIAQTLALNSLSDQQPEASPFERLSERELQVTLMISKGQSVADISERLCISSKTVNGYRYRLFAKLGIKNDVELTYLAMKYQLIEEPTVVEPMN